MTKADLERRLNELKRELDRATTHSQRVIIQGKIADVRELIRELRDQDAVPQTGRV